MNQMTTFLFAIPRLLFGFARTLDLGATFDEYNTSKTPSEADWKAISNDWQTVGEDMRYAIAKAQNEIASTAALN